MQRIFLMVAPMMVIAVLLSPSAPAAAQDEVPSDSPSWVHIVQPAESLLDLQLFYRMTAHEIAAVNSLPPQLASGQEIAIPIAASNVPVVEVALAAPATYIVERGDTLFRIATRFNIPLDSLAAANEIVWYDRIYVGQVLVLPGSDYVPPTLEERIAYTQAELPADQIPEPTILEGKQIVVVISQQRTYAFENGVLLRHFVVSTGLPATPTVTGDFKIYVKLETDRMTGPGYDLWGVPWVMYFYRGYALHGTYWHDNFGNQMSHGCVNFRPAEAEWLFHWAEVGTPVHVIH